MAVSRMSMGIIKLIDQQYNEYGDGDCLDIIQIKNICNLYKVKSSVRNDSVSLSDITFSSPELKSEEFNNVIKPNNKNQADILKSQEFIEKYTFFIRIITM